MNRGGFNLIGFPRSPTAHGEDFRMLAAMLDQLGIAYSVWDLDHRGKDTLSVRFEFMTNDDYAASIFMMPPAFCEQIAAKLPRLFDRHRLKIGFFAWDMPVLPEKFAESLKLFDQIWAPSQFSAAVLASACSVPVKLMPLPVELADPEGVDFRQQLHIPAEDFVVLSMLDANSTSMRRNAEGTIEAFTRFARQSQHTWLILKVRPAAGAQKSLLDWLPLPPNVRVLKQTLPTGQITDLYRAANCYLSMHRCEGFGRPLVQAMQSGLPVVATDFSGPADFLDAISARFVKWTLKSTDPWRTSDGSVHCWADPDCDDAARQLAALKAQPELIQTNHIRLAGRRLSVAALAELHENWLDSCLGYRDRTALAARPGPSAPPALPSPCART